ncbi:MAG: hypothetical protein GC182_12800 [Rhodopseudomonas sp.]|nr:hypothetical protein [Rhodopseudomonas sp.]
MSQNRVRFRTPNRTVKPSRLRHVLAGLMTLTIVAASFTLALRMPALAISVAAADTAQAGTSLTAHHRQRPTPCHKSIVPGTVTTCPLATFNVNGMPVQAVGLTMTAGLDAARWTFGDTSRPPQCLGLSPYRPPCATA